MKLRTAAIAVVAFIAYASVAKAADLYKPPVDIDPPGAAEYKRDVWSGFYVEGGIGIVASDVEVSAAGSELLTLGDNAFAGHLGLGYDYQFSKHGFVGVLGRAEINELKWSAFGQKAADTSVEWLAAGRIGWIPREDWAVYVLGGYRWGDLDISGTADTTRNAWIAGIGIEAFVTDHAFIGVEATGAWSNSDSVPALPAVSTETTDYAGKVRLGYKF